MDWAGVNAGRRSTRSELFIVSLLVPLLVITNIYSLWPLARSRAA
jgi:hypothetical protein